VHARKRIRLHIPATEHTPPIIVLLEDDPIPPDPGGPSTGPAPRAGPCRATLTAGTPLTIHQHAASAFSTPQQQDKGALRPRTMPRLRLRLSVPPGHPYVTASRPLAGRGENQAPPMKDSDEHR
jgi:hypothetical protein